MRSAVTHHGPRRGPHESREAVALYHPSWGRSKQISEIAAQNCDFLLVNRATPWLPDVGLRIDHTSLPTASAAMTPSERGPHPKPLHPAGACRAIRQAWWRAGKPVEVHFAGAPA